MTSQLHPGVFSRGPLELVVLNTQAKNSGSKNPKRSRLSTPRSRSGCQTCRQRRIKCDETRPSCLRCVRSGWKCDGFGEPNAVRSTTQSLAIASYSLPFRIPGSRQDRQILHYFCVQGSHDLAGYLGSSFWSKTVLQASHHDPVVRQALVSLSSLHLDYATSEGPGELKSDIFGLHGKALRGLIRKVSDGGDQTIPTALICCALFYCFENTLGNSEVAMQHLQNGISILSHVPNISQGHRRHGHMRDVAAVFERLDLQETMFDDSREPSLHLQLKEELMEELKEAPVFENLDRAHETLTRLQNWLFHFLTRNVTFKDYPEDLIPPVMRDEKKRLLESFATWKNRFGTLESQIGSDKKVACGSKVLLIHWQLTRMVLLSDYPHNAAIFGGSPNIEAEKLIDLATDVLRATVEGNASAEAAKTPRRNFSSDTGVVAPLFILAMKCSDASICERATELLAMSQRREGPYDSQTMADITSQFRHVLSQRSLERTLDDMPEMNSLEKSFEAELDGVTGGMDRLAEYVRSLT